MDAMATVVELSPAAGAGAGELRLDPPPWLTPPAWGRASSASAHTMGGAGQLRHGRQRGGGRS